MPQHRFFANLARMGSRSRHAASARAFASLAALVVVSAACSSTSSAPAAADPSLVEAREQQLLAPFGETRTIVADRLDIEMTANFHDELTRPAVLPGSQDEQRIERPDGGTELRYTTSSATTPLRFVIGNTDLRVTRAARIGV